MFYSFISNIGTCVSRSVSGCDVMLSTVIKGLGFSTVINSPVMAGTKLHVMLALMCGTAAAPCATNRTF